MRTITTLALALFVSFAVIPAPAAQACGGTYSLSPQDTVTSAAYAYLAGHEPLAADATWSVERVEIVEHTAHADIRWNGRLHTLALATRVDGTWAVTRWHARRLPAAAATPAS